jgi:hypothetical protein
MHGLRQLLGGGSFQGVDPSHAAHRRTRSGRGGANFAGGAGVRAVQLTA